MIVFQKILEMLDENGFEYRKVHHEPTFTSEESAKARGEGMEVGGKALLVKVDDTFRLFVLSAVRKLDTDKIKVHFKAKKIRFASKEELFDLTTLVPGCVPPFGKPIFNFDLFVDPSVLKNEIIAFNAGSLTDSVIMKVSDWEKLAQPVVLDFSLDS